jgi:DNA-binding PadR family transcriptional regulator
MSTLKHALLALLVKQPRHGYELKTEFEKTMGGLWPELNIGQVYTTLARLERDGLALGATVDSPGERTDKRVYSLTSAGRKALQDWLSQPSVTEPIKDDFFAKLAFARLAGAGNVRPLIARQRQYYLQSIRILDEYLSSEKGGEASFSALLAEGALLHLQANLKWLDLCEKKGS